MPVPCACSHCGASSPVPEFLLGRAVRCPNCKQMFDAPAADGTPAASRANEPDDVPVVRVPAPAHRRGDDDDGEPRPFGAGVPWVALGVSGLLLVAGLVAVAFFGFLATSRSVVVGTAAVPVMPPPPIVPPPLGPDGGTVGTAPEAITGAEAAPPEPRGLAERLAGNDEDLDALAVQAITLPFNAGRNRFGVPGVAPSVVRSGGNRSVREVMWAADGNHFLVLTAFNEVYRVSYPGLKAVRGIDLGQEAEGLQRCAKGLIVTLPQLEQVWLLNAETLRVEQRKQLHGLHTAVTAPGLTYALALCGSRNTGAFKGIEAVVRIDWVTEDVTPLAAANVPLYLGFGLPNPVRPVLAPDGATLYACDADGRLAAFTIAGDALTLRESSAFAAGGELIALVLSADGKHLVSPAGNVATPTTAVVATDNLQSVLFNPNGRGQGHPAGFSADGKRVFTHADDAPLVEFDLAGEKVATHNLGPNRPPGTWGLSYAAHPNGTALLMLTTTELLLIEWRKK